jgi:CopG family transcriptional regulator/antitoxin EndoAI
MLPIDEGKSGSKASTSQYHLPEETIELVDRVAAKGGRSRFIADAVNYYLDARGRARLRKQLRTGAIRRAERDLKLVREWFTLDEEAWLRTEG